MMQTIKNWLLPIAMIVGALCSSWLIHIAFLMPWLIFAMLLFTFCRISPHDVKFNALHFWLVLIQLLGSVVLYVGLQYWNPIVAEGVFICVLAPTATAAAVITGMLGGNVGFLTSYVIVSNLGVSVLAPVLFSFIGVNRELPLLESMWNICKEVMPLLILPLVCAWALQRLAPKVHGWFLKMYKAPLYMWALSLTIVTGRTVYFLRMQESPDYTVELSIGLVTMVVCVAQFFFGRRLGRHYGDAVSAGQGLGQKNTVLAIWMSQIYLSPVASVGPAAYILWQNIINSYQLWKKRKK